MARTWLMRIIISVSESFRPGCFCDLVCLRTVPDLGTLMGGAPVVWCVGVLATRTELDKRA
jgi:hypothetical protein